MKLNQYQRDRIRNLLVSRAFDEEEAALDKRQKEVGMLFYRDRISEAVEKQADRLNEVCPGMVRMDKSFYVTVGEGGDIRRAFAQFDRARPVTSEDLNWANDSEPAIALAKYELDYADYSVRRDKALKQADAALASFSTFRRLEIGWPEVMPIVREIYAEKAPQTLPAIPTAELNAMFDLPVETKEAA